MGLQLRLAAGLVAALSLALPAAAEETPKRGGTLTYMIPADAPPSFDAHRETTYATIHSAAPFYSVLIRANPLDPGKPGDFVCDLCTEMPKPTDDGKTYTFKIRDGVKFHDGSPLTAADVAASWNHIVFPPEGVLSPRQSHYMMVDKIEAPDPSTVVFRLKFATNAFLPALADPIAGFTRRPTSTRIRAGTKKHIGLRPVQIRRTANRPGDQGSAQPRLLPQGPALSRRLHRDLRRQAGGAGRRDPRRPGGDRVPRLSPSVRDELVGALGDKLTVQTSDWNCGTIVEPNHKKKPFDDVRVRAP